MRPKLRELIVAGALLAVAVATSAAGGSRVEEIRFFSDALGHEAPALVYLPAGYEVGEGRFPVLYLLHGRGDDMRAWLAAKDVLDELIATGRIPPVIAVLPDAPMSRRAGFYIDSRFAGADGLPAGQAAETAIARDLVDHVDRHFRTRADRAGRIVAGYSMGGFGAVRLVFAHPERFSAAIVLSPALYLGLPAEDSSMRAFGAFGLGNEKFDPATYLALSRAWEFRNVGAHALRVFLVVGDDEPARNEQQHSLTSDAAELHRVLRGVAGLEIQFRVLDGGHGWKVWRPGFEAGLLWLFGATEK
jgi:enterochelin esterase-like enzyme